MKFALLFTSGIGTVVLFFFGVALLHWIINGIRFRWEEYRFDKEQFDKLSQSLLNRYGNGPMNGKKVVIEGEIVGQDGSSICVQCEGGGKGNGKRYVFTHMNDVSIKK